jgi:cell division septum initiation protein DivIVA
MSARSSLAGGLPTGLGGYDRGQVERLLAAHEAWYEEVERESAELAARLDELERGRRESDLDELLASALASSRQAAAEVRGRARREHDERVEEARRRAEDAGRRAAAERAVAEEAVRGLRARRAERTAAYRAALRAALAQLDRGGGGLSAARDDLDRLE